jgi:hypothetical protein
MNNTTRSAGFRKAMFGTLALMLASLGCAQDRLVLGEQGDALIGQDPTVLTDDVPVECGAPSIQALTAGQTIDIGSIAISNDADNLYVKFETKDGWVLGTTHVHVGTDINDVPKAGNGQPIPGQFEYSHEIDVAGGEPGVTSDTFIIPLASLDSVACGSSLFIWAHAEAFLMGVRGTILQQETAWGGDTPGTGSRRWFFLAQYDVACCEDEDEGGFRTQTQGGWGTECNGGNPGCYRDEHFDAAFASGLVIGCSAGHTLTFTSSSAVQAFLPAGGTPGILNQSAVDPLASSAGVFAGQLTAASLSVGFDAADPDFSESSSSLAGLVLCNTGSACDGLSVSAVAADANPVIGGCAGATGLSAAQLSSCLALVNENFVDGTSDEGHLCAP